ncbi:class I SAM-dependent methyltransferase [Streptomyces sp. URMC 129]|uniref:class I SAM-dependent methyltransferase n=1 Tax=Streptomyces sp. URMC 129 TaxID=3423407 RepID=UPI003F1CD2C1
MADHTASRTPAPLVVEPDDEGGREMLHALRLAALLRIIGDRPAAGEPLFLLDAGCGDGRLARALARCGHRVDAFDSDPEAVDRCRAEGGGPRYAVADLAEWHSPWLYDAVLCLDVLPRVPGGAAWETALTRLASLVRLTGTLVVTDEDVPAPVPRDDDAPRRPTATYRAVLEPLGMRYDGFAPYGFQGDRAGFHVFARIR